MPSQRPHGTDFSAGRADFPRVGLFLLPALEDPNLLRMVFRWVRQPISLGNGGPLTKSPGSAEFTAAASILSAFGAANLRPPQPRPAHGAL